jgi:hypothetical protein
MSFATQTSYPLTPQLGIPGDRSDGSLLRDRLTKAATERIFSGKGLVYFAGSNKTKVRLPLLNRLIFTLGGDIVTGKSFQGTVGLTAFGAAQQTTTINVPFNTDHLTTMQDIKAAFEAIAGHGGNVTATISGATNRVLTVDVVNNKALAVTGTFAVNTSGASVTLTNSSSDTIIGLSGFNPNLEKDANQLVYYSPDRYVEVPLARKGRLWIQPATALAATDTLFVRFTDGGTDNRERGTFQNTAGTAQAEVAFAVTIAEILRTTTTADDINELEILFPVL